MQEVVIEGYIREVRLSEKRREKYYELGKKSPLAAKYHDPTKFEYRDYKGKKFLFNKKTNERVVANAKSAGTPRDWTINGQSIYNGQISEHTRAKVFTVIKDSFVDAVNTLKPITKFPIRIEMEIHDIVTSHSNLFDVDNRAMPYIKAFQDCLTGYGQAGTNKCKVIIPDDNVLYVTGPPAPKFIPISDPTKRKLVFRLLEEDDERILNNKEYMSMVNNLKV